MRLRLLDGANARNFRLTFADERIFPCDRERRRLACRADPQMKEIEISPGERYEIIVDLSGRPGGRSAHIAGP